MLQSIRINADNDVSWNRAHRADNNQSIDSGSGTWTLRELDGEQIATGALSPDGENGEWHGVLPKAVAAELVDKRYYLLEWEITGPLGEEGFERRKVPAGYN